MQRRVLAAIGAIGGSVAATALVSSGCALLAGYEDLRFNPPETETADGAPLGPLDLRSAAIYSVYPAIFSAAGNLANVTAKLGQIHDLGFNVLSLMPVTPIGQAIDSHPSVQSPYCVHDYYAVNPAYGAAADLTALVQAAHQLGMYVLLDEQINQTAWDNALIQTHPEYYVHTDLDPTNPATIAEAFNDSDVAQLNYQTSQYGLQTYITTMLQSWLTTYDLDGFRFITADLPVGNPRIPIAFWQGLLPALQTVKPAVVIWADDEDPLLAGAPFPLDYGWTLRGGQVGQSGAGLQQVATGARASELQTAWQAQTTGFSGVLHATLLQNWDLGDDLTLYGGVPNTMAAAVFDFTIDGVPLLWNGEEVGNDASGANTHTLIDWNGANAATFTALYKSLLTLRNGSTALQRGTTSWVTNSAPDQIASYARSDSSGVFLITINFSSTTQTGTFMPPAASGWTDVSPQGSPGGKAHVTPPAFSLGAYDFAIFRAD